jgi:hypothetical protein
MQSPQFKEKFIAFVDILGFKQMVAAAERGGRPDLNTILRLREKLGRSKDHRDIREHGPCICPSAPFIHKDLDFQLSQVSDCAVISAEISPAGAINLISHIWTSVLSLMIEGVMCRGYVTRGRIHHEGMNFVGSGYPAAYDNESQTTAFKQKADERGTPFVELDKSVCDYVTQSGDPCVKMMFGRLVRSESGASAIFPFKRLAHSFIVAGPGTTFDPQKELFSNENMRNTIHRLREQIFTYVDQTNSRAMEKASQYARMLDEQIAVCDRTDQMIHRLTEPVSVFDNRT